MTTANQVASDKIVEPKAIRSAKQSDAVDVAAEAPSPVRKRGKGKGSKKRWKSSRKKRASPVSARGGFPRHSVEKALRIPRAILDQNAGKPCTAKDAARFVGVKATGPFMVEVASATKYGWLDRLDGGNMQPSALAKKAIRPQSDSDQLDAMREAVLKAPEISDLYKHYRGENLPDDEFFKNTAVDTYHVVADKFAEFRQVFLESLDSAKLLAKHGEKMRVVDVAEEKLPESQKDDRIKKLGRQVSISATDSCFIMQPFKPPLGDYYDKIYKPAIEKAGLRPIRADADIFGTGKIIDQIWSGINAAKVLVAELTSRNPNVFYELGLAHALRKPVVLVSSNEADVPFDLQHIRVIYYDVNDPFWGTKLIEKVAENILSALGNPAEAIFPTSGESM